MEKKVQFRDAQPPYKFLRVDTVTVPDPVPETPAPGTRPQAPTTRTAAHPGAAEKKTAKKKK